MRWCLRVCDGSPTGAAGCGADLAADSRGVVRLGLEDTGAFEPLLFSCLALRRSQYLRHQCSAGFPPSARSACPHRARRNRKAAQPSTDAQSLRAPLAVVGADAFIGPLRQFPRGAASGSEKRSWMYPGHPRAEGFPKGRAFPSLTAARDCQPSPAGGRRSAPAQTDPPRHFFFSTGRGAFSF